MKYTAVGIAAACSLLASCIENPINDCYQRPIDEEGPWILLDHYHGTKQNPVDYRLTKTDYNYQGVFGFYRLFQHLDMNGYNWAEIRDNTLSRERLDGYDVLFINLVSSDRPDFEEDEIDAIIEFVENGGGLYVIADHTNVYRHAERVNRFLEPMGIEVMYHIATDQPSSGHAIGGTGWILVDDFTDHPVGQGLKKISLQTGGPMRTNNQDGAVALTSEDSFADFWDEEDDFGFYGNWRWDGDEEVEPLGPLEVVSAVEYGKGRIVVVGDQNIYGDSWIHYVDNFELALNGFEWTAKQDDSVVPLRETRPVGTLIGIDQSHTNYHGGKSGANSHFVFYVNSNRDAEITGRGTIRFDNVDDALVLMNPNMAFEDIELLQIRSYLQSGKKVVVSFDPSSVTEATQQLLADLAPEFQITTPQGTFGVGDQSLIGTTSAKVEIGGHFALSSTKVDVSGLSVAQYDRDPTDTEMETLPYLMDVTSDWGSALITADANGRPIDVARSKAVEDGELIIIVQDGLFRNRSMGNYLKTPRDWHKDTHELQYRLMNYMKVEVPVERQPVEENTRCGN